MIFTALTNKLFPNHKWDTALKKKRLSPSKENCIYFDRFSKSVRTVKKGR